MSYLKNITRELTPPLIKEIQENRRNKRKAYGWFGNYMNWEEAAAESSGYNSTAILEKVKKAVLAVKKEEAVYERDSVLFDKIQYSWPVLAGLLWAAAKNKGSLSVLDFGGSLGSSYFQNRRFLRQLESVRWSIVEQQHYVECGKKNFEDGKLIFYYTVDECCAMEKPNVALLSSVLPYLKDPYGFLQELFKFKIPLIITDLTGYFDKLPTRITVQKVNPKVYKASYPCRIFNMNEFKAVFSKYYDVVECFDSPINEEFFIDYNKSLKAGYKGFIFQRRMHE